MDKDKAQQRDLKGAILIFIMHIYAVDNDMYRGTKKNFVVLYWIH